MNSKRKLGLVLALTGAGIAIAAAIAGFMIIGGPGDARDQRLDEMTDDRIADAARTAQCAYFGNGTAPETIEQATMPLIPDRPRLGINCNQFNEIASRRSARTGVTPEGPGDVTYFRIDSSKIRLCGEYRRANEVPADERHPRGRGDVLALFPSLRSERPQGGLFCYELGLVTRPAG